MPGIEQRMVEYSDPLHTCLLHDSLRPAVLEGRESVYFPETESFVRIFQAGGGRFGRISVAPCFADQPPGDLDSRSEVRFERNPVEAGKAKELSVRFPFDGICSVTEIGEFVPDAEEKAEDSLTVSGFTKYSMTFGSAFISVNGSRSLSCQSRRISRGVSMYRVVIGRWICDRLSAQLCFFAPPVRTATFLPVFVDNGQNDRFHDFVALRIGVYAVAAVFLRQAVPSVLQGGVVVYIRDAVFPGVPLDHSVQLDDPVGRRNFLSPAEPVSGQYGTEDRPDFVEPWPVRTSRRCCPRYFPMRCNRCSGPGRSCPP